MKKITIGVLVLSLYSFNAAYAFKCGHKLVTEGDYSSDVLARCGEPDSIKTHTEIVTREQSFPNSTPETQQAIVEIEVEEWVYNFGRSRLQQFLRFENGKLETIQSLGRGN